VVVQSLTRPCPAPRGLRAAILARLSDR
jgi:hypothetical protein